MYYGQIINGIRVDRLLYDNYFKNKTNGFFIECGAYDGLMDATCKFFEEELNWIGINIEPHPIIYKELIKNRINSFVNLNIALSNKQETVKFITSSQDYSACGSIGGNDYLLSLLNWDATKLVEFMVNTITYKNMIEQYDIQSVDLFVLDVEGHELEVFEGMQSCSVIPNVMCVEYGHVGLSKIIDGAKSLGLKFDKADVVNAFFVKE